MLLVALMPLRQREICILYCILDCSCEFPVEKNEAFVNGKKKRKKKEPLLMRTCLSVLPVRLSRPGSAHSPLLSSQTALRPGHWTPFTRPSNPTKERESTSQYRFGRRHQLVGVHGHREEVHGLSRQRQQGNRVRPRENRPTFCDCMATSLNMSRALASNGATLNSSVSGSFQ